MSTAVAAALLIQSLAGWEAPSARLELLRRQYLGFVQDRGLTALQREGGAAHITASCFILSTDLQHTVLAFHRKGRFWAQTGGHLEPGDPSVPAAALREAREDSGLARLALVPDLLDLDRHELTTAFGSCRTHWDVGCAALASADQVPQVSEESEDVAWFSIDDLPAPLAGSVHARIELFRDAIRPDVRGRS